MTSVRELTLFFPAYDEAENVAACIDAAVSAANLLGLERFEVLFVDDGSRDGTADTIRAHAAGDERIRVVSHPRNLGYGAAVLTGIESARYEHFFMTDADLQFDLGDLARMLPLAADHDVVQGYRIGRSDPRSRIWLGDLYRQLVRATLAIPVRDPECSFRLARTAALRDLTVCSRGPFVPVELLLRAARTGARFAELGVRHHPRRSGRSHALSLRTVRMLGADVLRFALHERRERSGR